MLPNIVQYSQFFVVTSISVVKPLAQNKGGKWKAVGYVQETLSVYLNNNLGENNVKKGMSKCILEVVNAILGDVVVEEEVHGLDSWVPGQDGEAGGHLLERATQGGAGLSLPPVSENMLSCNK